MLILELKIIINILPTDRPKIILPTACTTKHWVAFALEIIWCLTENQYHNYSHFSDQLFFQSFITKFCKILSSARIIKGASNMLVQEVGELYQIYHSGFSIVGGTPSILQFYLKTLKTSPLKLIPPMGFPYLKMKPSQLKNKPFPIEKWSPLSGNDS